MFVDLIYNEITQNYEASYPAVGSAVVFATSLSGDALLTNPIITGQIFAADGTALLPGISYTTDPDTGIARLAANSLAFSIGGATRLYLDNTILALGSGVNLNWANGTDSFVGSGDTQLGRHAAGIVKVGGVSTIGSAFKADALPTISSGFGTSPAVTALSTPLSGSVNVGTGGVATTGVILWNGTAFPSTPFIVCTCSLGAVPTVAVATTTQVTFTTSVAWPASTILNWIAISSK